MNDDLLEWLDCPCSSKVCLPRTAKAHIEAQAAEIEKLRERIERLRKALYAAYDDEPGWCDLTRAALGETK